MFGNSVKASKWDRF